MQTPHRLRHLVAATSLALLCLCTQAPAFARTEEANFITLTTTVVADQPNGIRGELLRANDGNIYFTSENGGLGRGFIGKIAPDGTISTLHAFAANALEGGRPFAGVMQATDGNLYGTTYYGGDDGSGNAAAGTVFRVTLAGQITVLHSFGKSSTDPSLPYAGLVQASDGNLYGTTLRAGTYDKGAIFRISLAGDFTIVHEFNGADGENPEGTLIVGSDGALYGTTLQGGPDNRGTVYRITTAGVFTSLYSFPSLSAFNLAGVAVNATGANPRSGLLLAADGNYYGTTYQGGPEGYGTVYRMTPAGAVSVFHAFEGATQGGASPLSSVVQDTAGNFYGTTSQGGYLNQGTAWRINSSGQFKLLHGFVDLGVDGDPGKDGKNPSTGLLLANGSIYGATYTSITGIKGAIFKLDLGSGGTLPVELSVSPALITRGDTSTITWSSPTATSCTASGVWDHSARATSGTLAVTPTLASIYIYSLSCTDGAGVIRTAYTGLIAQGPTYDPVDGGGGGGVLSVSLLLLLAALLFRKSLREIVTECP